MIASLSRRSRLLAFSGARSEAQGKALIDKVWHLRDVRTMTDLI